MVVNVTALHGGTRFGPRRAVYGDINAKPMRRHDRLACRIINHAALDQATFDQAKICIFHCLHRRQRQTIDGCHRPRVRCGFRQVPIRRMRPNVVGVRGEVSESVAALLIGSGFRVAMFALREYRYVRDWLAGFIVNDLSFNDSRGL